MCSDYELLNIVAALAVFSDSYLFRKKELVLIIEEELFEEFKAIPIDQFFKIYDGQEIDDKVYRFKPYFYFAREVFKEIEKRQ